MAELKKDEKIKRMQKVCQLIGDLDTEIILASNDGIIEKRIADKVKLPFLLSNIK